MATTETQDWTWTQDAACKGHDPAMWFEPTVNDPETHEKNQIAKRICNACSVKVECLNYALPNERYGIWGGFSANEREKIRRQRNIHLVPRRPV